MAERKSPRTQVHKNAAGKTAGRSRRKTEPVQTTTVPKEVMAAGRAAVRGRDVHLVVQPDGTVLIVNGERKTK